MKPPLFFPFLFTQKSGYVLFLSDTISTISEMSQLRALHIFSGFSVVTIVAF
jgi:hypothetical protein